MNFLRNEFDLRYAVVTGANGQEFSLTEIPSKLIGPFEADAVVIDGAEHIRGEYVVARHNESHVVFEVEGRPSLDRYTSRPDPAEFDAPGFTRLVVLPKSVFEQGCAANPEPYVNCYSPSLASWQAVPKDGGIAPGNDIEQLNFQGRRFFRLTPTAAAALLTERMALLREQQSAAAAEAGKRQREETLAAQQAERDRQERRTADEHSRWFAWYGAWPDLLKPGKLVLDLTEATPRVAIVKYEGVHLNADGTFRLSIPVEKLPNRGRLYWNDRPVHPNDDTRMAWDHAGYWDQREFYTYQVASLEPELLEYVGPERPIGSRVPRGEALAGREDPLPPSFGDLEFARIDILGNEFNSRAGDLMTVEDALDVLKERAPSRLVQVRRKIDDENNEDEDSERDIPQAYEVSSEEQLLEERYPQLYGTFRRWDDEWDDFPWGSTDRKLLKKESGRREQGNIEWMKRRPLYAMLMGILNGRPFTTDNEYEKSQFGDQALMFDVALAGDQLDHLVKQVRGSGCQVLVRSPQNDERQQLAATHVAPRGEDWAEIWQCWKDCKGSPDLFLSFSHAIRGVKTVKFTIDGFLASQTNAVLIGPAGVGKSTLAYQMAASVAAGAPFAGLETVHGVAVYVYGEDSEDFISYRRQAAATLTSRAGRNLIELHVDRFDRSLPKIVEFIRTKIGPVALLVVDTIGLFVSDTNIGGAVKDALNVINEFCSQSGAAAITVHHTNKDLPASSARSAKIVFDKMRGSGEFINSARQVWTIHLESEHKDPKRALDEGLRHITMVKKNIPVGVPHLQNSLAMKMDLETQLSENVVTPIIATSMVSAEGKNGDQKPERKAKQRTADLDRDADEIAKVIRRIEADGHGPVPVTGIKSPFKLRKSNELVRWTRARCEAAHKRAMQC